MVVTIRSTTVDCGRSREHRALSDTLLTIRYQLEHQVGCLGEVSSEHYMKKPVTAK